MNTNLIEVPESFVTVDELISAVPIQYKGVISAKAVKDINMLQLDEDFRDMYKDNLILFAGVLDEGKFHITKYYDAVRYASHKLLGKTNTAAFSATFAAKCGRWRTEGKTDKEISSYVHAYSTNKLVSLITNQSIIPLYIANLGSAQLAIDLLLDVIQSEEEKVSPKVKIEAANMILTHLKIPEVEKIQISVNTTVDTGSDAIADLTSALDSLTTQMQTSIKAGAITADALAGSPLIEGEYEEAVIVEENTNANEEDSHGCFQ